MFKNRLLASTFLAAPLYLILSSGAAFAMCFPSTGNIITPDPGAEIVCDTSITLGTSMGSGTENFDVRLLENVAVSGTTGNTIFGGDLNVTLDDGSSLTNTDFTAITTSGRLNLMGANNVTLSNTSATNTTIYMTGGGELEFGNNARVLSDGYAISARDDLILTAGDNFRMESETSGVFAEGTLTIFVDNDATFISRGERYNDDMDIDMPTGMAVTVDHGNLNFTAQNGLNIQANLYGLSVYDGNLNVELLDDATFNVFSSLTVFDETQETGDALNVDEGNMDFTAGDRLTIDADYAFRGYGGYVDVEFGNHANINVKSDAFYVRDGNLTVNIGDNNTLHADLDVFDIGNDDKNFLANITIGSDNTITAGDNAFEIDGNLIFRADHNNSIVASDVGVRGYGLVDIGAGNNLTIEGEDDYGIYTDGNILIEAGANLSISGGEAGIRVGGVDLDIVSGANTLIHGGEQGIRFNSDFNYGNLNMGAGSVVSGDGVGIRNANNLNVGSGVTVRSLNGTGIVGSNNGSLIDISGTIEGGNGTAIQLGSGDDTLALRTGAALVGNVYGGAGFNTLYLSGTGVVQANTGLYQFSEVLIDQASSSWTLEGDRDFARDVRLNAGTLIFAGNVNIGGDLDVVSGATLGLGVGTQGGVISVEENANLQGNLSLFAAGTLSDTQSHALILTGGTVNGKFTSFENTFNYLQPRLRYESDGVFLDFGRDLLDIPDRTGNGADRTVAQSFDKYFESNPNGLMDVQNLLTTSTDAQIENLLASQTGQIVLSSMNAAGSGASATSQVALNRVAPSTSGVSSGDVSNPTTYWIQATGGRGKVDSNANANGTKYTSAGTVFGAERSYNTNETYGLFAGYSHSNSKYNASALHDKGSTGVYQLGVYGGHSHGAWDFAGTVSGAYMDFETKRPTGLGVAKADFNGGGVFADIEMAYNMVVGEAVNLSPLLALEGSYIRHQSYRENGAGGLNMAVSSDSTKNLTSVLGARAEKTFATDATALTAALELGWAHQYLDRNGQTQATMIAAPTVSYTTSGVKRDRNSARVGFSLTLAGNGASDNGFTGYVSYNGDFAKNARDQAATIGIRYRW